MSPFRIAEGSKTVTALIGLAITYASQYYGSNHWVTAAIALAGVLGVYAVPNVARSAPADSIHALSVGDPASASLVPLPPGMKPEAGPLPLAETRADIPPITA